MLQAAIALGCIVPISAGLEGALQGVGFLGGAVSNMDNQIHYFSSLLLGSGELKSVTADMDSHFRYLSGLLLGIGLGFLSSIAHIERHTARVRLLTLIVVLGGAGRLIGFFISGIPGRPMQFALAMELVVTPLLCLWQGRVAQGMLKVGGERL